MCVEKFNEFMLHEDTVWNNYPYQEKGNGGVNKMFIKTPDKKEGRVYGFWGLKIRSHEILKKVERLEVGQELNFPPWTEEGDSQFQYKITRIK